MQLYNYIRIVFRYVTSDKVTLLHCWLHSKNEVDPIAFFCQPLSHMLRPACWNLSKNPRLKFHVLLVPPWDWKTSTRLRRLVKWNQTAPSTTRREEQPFVKRGWALHGSLFWVTSAILDELRWIYFLTNMGDKGDCFCGRIYLRESSSFTRFIWNFKVFRGWFPQS